MRICHFICSRGLGRGEVYVDLANRMASQAEVSLLIPVGALYRSRIDPSVRVSEYTARDTRYNPLLWLEIRRRIRALQPDVVHTHFAKATEVFALINRVLHLPHVATKHNPRKGRIYDQLPHVIAVSEAVRRSIHRADVTVIPNGILPVPVTRAPRKRTGLSILAAGRLEPIKGFDLLLRQVAQLRFDWHLTILGDGPQRANLEALVHNLGLADRVQMPGFRMDVPQHMANTDVLVLSSHSEGCSLVLLEGLFYAPLVLSTDTGAAREILGERFLFRGAELAAKLHDVWGNLGAYRRDFEQRRAAQATRFHLDVIVQEHVNYYRTVLNAEPRRSSGHRCF